MEPINEDSVKTLEKNNQKRKTDALVSGNDFDDDTDDFYVITNDFEDPKNKNWIFHKVHYIFINFICHILIMLDFILLGFITSFFMY